MRTNNVVPFVFFMLFSLNFFSQNKTTSNTPHLINIADTLNSLTSLNILPDTWFDYFINSSDNELAYADIEEQLEDLMNNKKNLNLISDEELKNYGVLNDYQINKLVSYRKRVGYILSFTELSMIDGFNSDVCSFLSNFFFLSENNIQRANKKNKYNLLIRNNTKGYFKSVFKGEIQLNKGVLVEFGGVIENDAGEGWKRTPIYPLFDFYSFNVAANNIYLGKKNYIDIRIGDFKCEFGQGLVLANSFSINSISSPFLYVKNFNGFKGYYSSDENAFFRGIALSFKNSNNISFSTFFSYKNIDAVIDGKYYTSIKKDGLHNTVNLLYTRKTLGQSVGGFNAFKEFKNIKIGLTALAYAYDKLNGENINYYNKYRFKEGVNYNIGVDFRALISKYQMFGEIAFDRSNMAFIAGLWRRVGDRGEMSFVGRNYGVSYTAPFSNPYSTLSYSSNQRGFLTSYSGFIKNLKIDLFGEYVYYPFPRFNIKEDSFMLKFIVQSSKEIKTRNNIFNIMLRVYNKINYSYRVMGIKGDFKYVYNLKGDMLNFQTQYEKGNGFVFLKGNSTFLNNYLSFKWGMCYYDISNWNSRMYIYEGGMNNVYNGRLLYKNGFAGYLYLGAKPFKNLKIHLKMNIPLEAKFGIDFMHF